jgi:Ca2+-binding EF-hand superfamily protein
MMPRRRLLPTVLVAVLAGACPATAQESGVSSIYARMDLNGDGAIDIDELGALRSRVFNRMDRNLDNQLDEAEFVDLWVDGIAPDGDPRRNDLIQLRRERFAELDENSDGAIEKKEYIDVGTNRFLTADRDGDGRLSLEEFEGSGAQ